MVATEGDRGQGGGISGPRETCMGMGMGVMGVGSLLAGGGTGR
jgi:hypothetical protein